MKCRDCGGEKFRRGVVVCELCGDHPALYCENCGEAYDIIYNDEASDLYYELEEKQ